MMEFKHTPGPWKVSETGIVTSTVYQWSPVIATVNSIDVMRSEEQNANMELIAVAPELLDVLVSIVNDPNYKYTYNTKNLIEKLIFKKVITI